MSRKAMQAALEALESDPISHAGPVTVLSPGKGTGFNYARASQKTAVSPDGGTGFIDGVWHEPGPTTWQCQCGKAYTVTCIASKPAKQEPVAWISHIPTIKVNGKQLHWTKEQAYKWSSDITPLYSAPKQWVGLTDEEVSDVIDNVLEGGGWLDVARALESAIKEKNT